MNAAAPKSSLRPVWHSDGFDWHDLTTLRFKLQNMENADG